MKQDHKLITMDNCSGHPHLENLEVIELFFLPKSMFSYLQPMEQDILHSLTAKYCVRILQQMIQTINKTHTLPQVIFFFNLIK